MTQSFKTELRHLLGFSVKPVLIATQGNFCFPQKSTWEASTAAGKIPSGVVPSSFAASTAFEPCMVCSFGSKNSVAFEENIHMLVGCEVHTHDPIVPASEFVRNGCATFHEWDLDKEGSPEMRAPSSGPERAFEPSATSSGTMQELLTFSSSTASARIFVFLNGTESIQEKKLCMKISSWLTLPQISQVHRI